MKKSIILLALGIFALGAYAQPGSKTKEVVSDTTEIIVGNKVISIISDSASGRDIQVITRDKDEELSTHKNQEWANRDREHEHGDDDHDGDDEDRKKKKRKVDVDFLALDLGMNFLTSDQSFNLPAEYDLYDTKPLGSTHLGFHFLKTRMSLIRHHVNLVTAITLDNNRYSFRNNLVLIPGGDSLNVYNDSVSYKKSKLITWHAQVPLLLNFQTAPHNEKKNFHLSVGGYAGLLLSAHTKRKSDSDKVRTEDDYNLNRYRYGAMGRIGYRNLDLYVKYDLSEMFQEDRGPVLAPITFGISLSGAM